MGDSADGSSNAAPSAQPEGQISKPKCWMSGLFGMSDTPETVAERPVAATTPVPQAHGMMNLRRMRVEDVAVPKADIQSVPTTITKTELVQLFRDSGLTRLPVYENTLDTPVGFVHLKDFALRHGFNGDNAKDFDITRVLRPLSKRHDHKAANHGETTKWSGIQVLSLGCPSPAFSVLSNTYGAAWAMDHKTASSAAINFCTSFSLV